MPVPALPALATRKFSANTAGATLAQALAAANAALTATVDDAGETGITAWLTTLDGGGNYLLFTPPSTSPIYQKVVYIIAGATASAPNAAAMLLDTGANAYLHFGMWVANAGSTVTMADYSSWSGAAPFTGSGTFSGYVRWYTPTATTRCVLFRTLEYMALIADQAGRWAIYGGAGLERMDTANGESGLGGRAFDFGTSQGAITSNYSVVTAVAGSLLIHGVTSNSHPHWYYRRPSTGLWRAMGAYGSSNVSRSPMIAADGQCMDDLGNFRAHKVVLKDTAAGAGVVNTEAGVHRFFHYGPWNYSDTAIRNAAGTRIFLTFGGNVATNCDCLALPV